MYIERERDIHTHVCVYTYIYIYTRALLAGRGGVASADDGDGARLVFVVFLINS